MQHYVSCRHLRCILPQFHCSKRYVQRVSSAHTNNSCLRTTRGRIVRTYCCVVKAIADTRQTIMTHRNEQLCFQSLCMYAVRGTAKDSKGRNDGAGRIGEPALGPRNGFEYRQNSRNINCLLLCELFEIPPSVRLSVRPSVRPSIHPSICLFVPCCHYYPHCIKLT